MPAFALYGAIFFTFALAFYSIGIWAEFFAKRLKSQHSFVFVDGNRALHNIGVVNLLWRNKWQI